LSLYIAVALVAMTSVALAALLLPLIVRQRGPAGRSAYNMAVYRDQLAEVERDAARGVLASGDAAAARAEIGRRILALKPGAAGGGGSTAATVVSVLAILAMPVAALLLYGVLGSPMMPDRPFGEHLVAASGPPDHQAAQIEMDKAIGQLQAYLKTHPDDLKGWLLLARSQAGGGHYTEASDAYRRAADLSGNRADILGEWGEAQVIAAGGTVTPAAREAFTAVLKNKETAPRSRYYLALAQMQAGDTKGALKAWTALAADSPADAAWLPVVRQRMAEAAAKLGIDPPQVKAAEPAGAAGMPSPATVANTEKALAGVSPDQRLAMINQMVERLAARLQQQPDDAAGWAQLGRSYMVLHEPAKAREAYARAVKLRPEDPELKAAMAEAGAAAGAPVQPSR
jgi:cytochrome c-type biogenesis protein CcmH